MPLRKYYSEQHLRNQSEAIVARMLNDDLSYSPEQWYMVHAYMCSGHKRDSAGECDFILIKPKGVVVLEIKGSKWKREKVPKGKTQVAGLRKNRKPPIKYSI